MMKKTIICAAVVLLVASVVLEHFMRMWIKVIVVVVSLVTFGVLLSAVTFRKSESGDEISITFKISDISFRNMLTKFYGCVAAVFFVVLWILRSIPYYSIAYWIYTFAYCFVFGWINAIVGLYGGFRIVTRTLRWFGFTRRGIARDTTASYLQSYIGDARSKTFFTFFQKEGAIGLSDWMFNRTLIFGAIIGVLFLNLRIYSILLLWNLLYVTKNRLIETKKLVLDHLG